MSIARKLRVALGVYIAILAATLAFLVHGTRRSLDAGRVADSVTSLVRRVDVSRPPSASELEQQRIAARVLREASQIAVAAEFGRSQRAARSAMVAAWVLATGAVLLGIALWVLLARAEQLERLRTELASNVSHDLKTPLSTMQEVTAALLDGVAGPLTEAQKRLLAANQGNARRLASMVEKLLELSRLESRPTPSFTTVDLVGIARRCADRVRATRRTTVTVCSTERMALVSGNVDDLERMVDNLVENAIRFSPPNGTVRVTVSVTRSPMRGSVHLTVSDEGPGIPDADKRRVFDRFYQTEAGRATRSGGVGLGLAICRRIVAEHGGSIAVGDNAPRGTIVAVVLPRSSAVSLRRHLPTLSKLRPARTESRRSGFA